jgi:hypothetical protein
VYTWFVPYTALQKRLSYVEQGKLRIIAENNPQLEVLANQFARIHRMDAAKFKRY